MFEIFNKKKKENKEQDVELIDIKEARKLIKQLNKKSNKCCRIKRITQDV